MRHGWLGLLCIAILSVFIWQLNGETASIQAATNNGTTATEQLLPIVFNGYDFSEQPRINAFTIADNVITNGESATLSWDVSNNVDTLTIDQGIGDVTGLSSVEVSPEQTTTYQLTAVNAHGQTIARVVVTVLIPPKELSYVNYQSFCEPCGDFATI